MHILVASTEPFCFPTFSTFYSWSS